MVTMPGTLETLEADAARETVLPGDLIIRRRPRGAEGRALSEPRRKAELVHGSLPIAADLRISRAGNDDRVEKDETLLVGDVPDVELEEWLDTPPDPNPAADRQVEAVDVLVFPGAALAITVIAFNLLNDGLRDALDPRLR